MNILGILTQPSAPSLVVTGGTLYTSGGFNYRVFTGNGTLGVTGGTLVADILIVAGGGGSYNGYGSGGGAGGLRSTVTATGGGGSHTHTLVGSATSSAITLDIQYVDLIIAQKN